MVVSAVDMRLYARLLALCLEGRCFAGSLYGGNMLDHYP